MAFLQIVWDLEGDSNGNVQHIRRHRLTREEIEDVLINPDGEEFSHSSNQPIAFGHTRYGELIAVVFEQIDEDTVYPITAFRVED